MIRRGWTKNSVPVGVRHIAEGFRRRTARSANGRDITFPDGKKLFIGSEGTGAPEEKPGRGRGGR
jgi:hypothetical protein